MDCYLYLVNYYCLPSLIGGVPVIRTGGCALTFAGIMSYMFEFSSSLYLI